MRRRQRSDLGSHARLEQHELHELHELPGDALGVVFDPGIIDGAGGSVAPDPTP